MSSTIQKSLKNQKQKYIDFSNEKNQKQQKYCQSLNILNKKTGTISAMDYDFNKKQYDNYLWLIFNSIYLQNKMEKEGNKVAFFITQTLPTDHHPYHTHDRHGRKLKNYIHNKKYNKNNTINAGYKKLNTAFRSIIKDFKNENDKYTRLYFNKVIEPHKTFVPHLHGLVYVNEEEAENFEKYFWSKNEQHGLGRAEITRIKDIKRSATYLTKYISKSIKPDNSKGNTKGNTIGNMYDGWKKYNKINVYTYSRVAIPRYIFSRVSNVLRLDIQDNENILEVIENLIDINQTIYEGGEIINTKSITKSNSRYNVIITKEKVLRNERQEELQDLIRLYKINGSTKELQEALHIDSQTLWDEVIDNALENGVIDKVLLYNPYGRQKEYEMLVNWLYDKEDILTYVSYRLTDFIVYDKKTDKVIYDKNDYELV